MISQKWMSRDLDPCLFDNLELSFDMQHKSDESSPIFSKGIKGAQDLIF